MARNAGALQGIASLQNRMALWEWHSANARNARVREESYQAKARSWMEQARINRDRAAAIHSRYRTAQSYNQYVNFENRYRYQVGVYRQAWDRYQRAAQKEALTQANHKASRVNFDTQVKYHLFGLVPFVHSHPMDSERIRNVVAITNQLRGGGEAQLAGVPRVRPSAGGEAGLSLTAGNPEAGGRQAERQLAMGHRVSGNPAEIDVAAAAEAEARPEAEAVPVQTGPAGGRRFVRAVAVEPPIAEAKPEPEQMRAVLRGLRTSQEVSFSEVGSVNVWSISGTVINPTGRAMKQARLRAVFYDEAGEEVRKEEKTVPFPPGVAETPISWNVKGVPLRAQRVEVVVVGTDKTLGVKSKTEKKAKRSI